MTVFLVIVLIIGNLFLFSGAVFDDLADNGIAWFFVIGAIAMDIYFIYLIAQSASKNREQQRIAAENNRIAEVTRKVEELTRLYSLPSLNANRTALPFKINPDLINKEVVFTVNAYKEQMQAIYARYSSITTEIKQILACRGCNSIDEKFSHLTTNEGKLKELKEEGEACQSHLSSYKIKMLNNDKDLLFEVKLAFRYLLNSKKCQSESISIKEFITPDKPNDLMLFSYENEPVVVFFEQCYFCLFSNVILIFDKSGVFSTAVDTSAMKVKIKRDTTAVTVSNGNAASNQYIAEDSKCVSRGTTRSTWLHTCRDGSPDLRYSYNPRLEYRTDTYEYVSIEFIISDKKVAFTASSSAVGDAFEKVTPSYTRKCNNRHDPIPEFLMLLKKLNADENAQIESIIQVCNSRSGANNYFCKLIAS